MAVLRKHTQTVEALLEAGFPVGKESARGWLALDIAVEAEDRPMVKVSVSVVLRECISPLSCLLMGRQSSSLQGRCEEHNGSIVFKHPWPSATIKLPAAGGST